MLLYDKMFDEFHVKKDNEVIEIVQRTPVWVFFLFFLLLILGYVQSKDRTLEYRRALIIPYVLFLFSLYGVVSSFGIGVGILVWGLGVFCGVVMGLRLSVVHALVYVPQTKMFIVKGSFVWLGLIMVLFLTKYTVGVMLARHVAFAQTLMFEAIISLIYGLFSGLFFARVVVLRHLHVKHKTLEAEECKKDG